MNDPAIQSDARPLPTNDLATAYQPRRVLASAFSLIWNVLVILLFIALRGPHRLEGFASHHKAIQSSGEFLFSAAAFATICFIGHAIVNYPVELWFGYLQERQFGLAKDGIRAWTLDWLHGVLQHGMQFIAGATLILVLQHFYPIYWMIYLAGAWLVLFLASSYMAYAMLPRGLFHFESPDETLRARLQSLVQFSLPKIVIFSSPSMRDFTGGMIGLGNLKRLLISRSTAAAASDNLLRFVLLHEQGHLKYHHTLLSTLAGWAWVALGMIITDFGILHFKPGIDGHLAYLIWMALGISIWMAVGEPMLAYLGRRLEYQADRFFLRNGGNTESLQSALEELSNRNHARSEKLRRRDTLLHPLPSIWNRVHAAKIFESSNLGRK